jgi:hypothetical protein
MLPDLPVRPAASGREIAVVTSRQCYDASHDILPARDAVRERRDLSHLDVSLRTQQSRFCRPRSIAAMPILRETKVSPRMRPGRV